MKLKLLAVSGATLLAMAAGIAHAQSNQPAPSMGQPSMQQSNTQAADMSYGGTPAKGAYASGRSRSGGPCVVGLSCDIYQGN
ncbi:hypothetical protein BGLT_05846 [Caballeronia glathei]|jgi:hypothetical protein|uniref:Uncharacterized protein n=1 Tax=Caballeronia glathei TaxID=60547 RepID=A0A069PQ19_9BURK|nr:MULTISPECIES: hypothetical protein [Burkholderiaceae]KDR39406.1 hypothetical protein BG61_32050 [Caballeronia glathei]TCK38707.1 hypothetical protein B0G84_4025 [Paraburkholderia sp. BL8N3]CDY76935.1 hypothetical protein BGLT_05846 [Caballeronia glathei]